MGTVPLAGVRAQSGCKALISYEGTIKIDVMGLKTDYVETSM